jgi:hypothetical protein
MPQDREAVDTEKQPSNLFSSNKELIKRAGSLSFLVAGEAYLPPWIWQSRAGFIGVRSFPLTTSAQAIW